MQRIEVLLQGQTNSDPEDVNAVSSKQSTPGFSTPRKCFACGSASHLQRDCSRVPPFRGRGRNRSRFFRGAPRGSTKGPITCFNCGGVGHVANQCSSPHLN